MRASVLGAVALSLTVAPLAAQPAFSINSSAAFGNLAYGQISSVGWYWTPSTTFFLSAILTKFNPGKGTNLDRQVTVEVWSDRPGAGGQLLTSAAFQSNDALGVFGGGTFSPFQVLAGAQYFIGFRNIQGLGVNYSLDKTAAALGNPYFSYGPRADDDRYNFVSDPIRKPMLELVGTGATGGPGPNITPVPEPLTMALLATGLVFLGGLTLLKRRIG